MIECVFLCHKNDETFLVITNFSGGSTTYSVFVVISFFRLRLLDFAAYWYSVQNV